MSAQDVVTALSARAFSPREPADVTDLGRPLGMHDTRTVHLGLLACLLLSAVLATSLHAKVEAQAARIATLEAAVSQTDGASATGTR